jgi:hypothetical protein
MDGDSGRQVPALIAVFNLAGTDDGVAARQIGDRIDQVLQAEPSRPIATKPP